MTPNTPFTSARIPAPFIAGPLLVLVLILGQPLAVFGQAQAGSSRLAPIAEVAEKAAALLLGSDTPAAVAEFAGFETLWSAVEDDVRGRNPQLYARIEVAATRAEAALEAVPPDAARAKESLDDLAAAARQYDPSASAGAPGAAASGSSISALITLLRQVKESLAAGDASRASDLLQGFVEIWPMAETGVKAHSAAAYAAVEEGMTRASSQLLSGERGTAGAAATVAGMLGRLEALDAPAGYTAWDAGVILLREGLEALLVLAALLAMLKKANAGGAVRWVWTGAGAGLLLSGAVAVVLGFAISAAQAGATRESVEGFVGLGSVVLMLSVGAWLHGQSSQKAWNSLIKDRVRRAVAAGGTWSFFALALFAILREGAEAVVFFLGIAPGISPGQLLAGVGAALVVLAALGYLLIRFSVKLPLHWLFLAATVLIYYVAFKVAGEAVRSLQIAGIMPAHDVPGLPSARFLGMTPTWETFVPQAAVLFLVIGEVTLTELRRARAAWKKAQAAPGST